jgi:hypothetical protein
MFVGKIGVKTKPTNVVSCGQKLSACDVPLPEDLLIVISVLNQGLELCDQLRFPDGRCFVGDVSVIG